MRSTFALYLFSEASANIQVVWKDKAPGTLTGDGSARVQRRLAGFVYKNQYLFCLSDGGTDSGAASISMCALLGYGLEYNLSTSREQGRQRYNIEGGWLPIPGKNGTKRNNTISILRTTEW